LEVFKITCDETLSKLWKQGGRKAGTKYSFVEFNKKLQNKLEIMDKIRALIYDNHDPNKFINEELTGKTKINPKYINPIKEYNELK
jgi:hypothetical protein